MAETRKLTLKENLLLVLGCALFFSIVMTVVGPLASQQTSDHIATFATDGATTTGKVLRKQTGMMPVTYAPLWSLQIEFKTDEGEEIVDWLKVVNGIYDRYAIGDPVRVTYARSRPSLYYIPGMAPTAGDVSISNAMTKYAELAAGVSFLAILVVLFAGRSGGAPKGRTSAPKPLAAAPLGPRGEFGARRRA